MTKKSWQKIKYLENEKSFSDELKALSITFKGLSMMQIIHFFLEGDFLKVRL